MYSSTVSALFVIQITSFAPFTVTHSQGSGKSLLKNFSSVKKRDPTCLTISVALSKSGVG